MIGRFETIGKWTCHIVSMRQFQHGVHGPLAGVEYVVQGVAEGRLAHRLVEVGEVGLPAVGHLVGAEQWWQHLCFPVVALHRDGIVRMLQNEWVALGKGTE